MEDPVIVKQRFKCDPKTLWSAITTHKEMIQWFFENIPEFRPEVGFKVAFTIENEGRLFQHLWEIKEVIPMKRIVYDWRYTGYQGSSSVTFEIEALAEGAELSVYQKNDIPYDPSIPEFTRESCEGGWQYFIRNRLKVHLNDNSVKT